MFALALAALGWTATPDPGRAAACEKIDFDGAPFTYCVVDLDREELRLWLRDGEGKPFGSFRNLDAALAAQGAALGVAMNAGMYHPDRAPVGLYIEDGVEEMRIVTSEGPGNFGLLPNGVFCLAGDRARVIESRSFAETPPACDYATQSGPMLVIDGALHPRFLPDSDSRYVRNGIGVRADGREVVMAISDRAVNFHHFARLFRDRLDVPDALYFDGNVSRLHAPGLGRIDGGFPMGPIIGTVVPAGDDAGPAKP
ncbi:phosphodiester glycosidase family protein [Mesobaculum littorinae]|uniref:phosphodiester glycosidase family protein n=1 Tax=Mesobaculum littorinae TaxID=2486419 RepID=UPI001F39651B|nr:phosphodiester glycosidase family protein [Mesobaculum littorinae]